MTSKRKTTVNQEVTTSFSLGCCTILSIYTVGIEVSCLPTGTGLSTLYELLSAFHVMFLFGN